MSQRERWIIYPLLFFSFSLAIRDQWPSEGRDLNFDVIRCRRLLVLDERGRVSVDLRTDGRGDKPGSGTIALYADPPNALGEAKLAAVKLSAVGGTSGVVETFGPLGARSVQVFGDQSGGHVRLFDLAGKPKNVSLRLVPNRIPDNKPNTGVSAGSVPTEEDPRQALPRPPIPPEDVSEVEERES